MFSILSIFNKFKNANYDINKNDKIQYMFKALPKEFQIDFLTRLDNTDENYKIITILSNLGIYLLDV